MPYHIWQLSSVASERDKLRSKIKALYRQQGFLWSLSVATANGNQMGGGRGKTSKSYKLSPFHKDLIESVDICQIHVGFVQIVVLTWGSSQRDLEAVERILSQVCQAYRKDGGKVVVVISQREKLEMEAMYRSVTSSVRILSGVHSNRLVLRVVILQREKLEMVAMYRSVTSSPRTIVTTILQSTGF